MQLSLAGGSDGKESACNAGDMDSIPGSERSPGGGNGYPLQYSCWRIPWTEEPGGLQSMGSQRVGQDWESNTLESTMGWIQEFPQIPRSVKAQVSYIKWSCKVSPFYPWFLRSWTQPTQDRFLWIWNPSIWRADCSHYISQYWTPSLEISDSMRIYSEISPLRKQHSCTHLLVWYGVIANPGELWVSEVRDEYMHLANIYYKPTIFRKCARYYK